MGRRDAVPVTVEVINRMRQLDPRLVVSYEPGWETRGNGTSANYEGGIVHHTAGASSLAKPFPSQKTLRDGRPDLSGPLCNEAAPACTVEQPRIHVVSANPANHAGASGGRSMGPLPVTSLFNPRVRGLEVDYAGTVPMLAGQLYVAHLWARANADVVGGGNIERIRAHFETSITGKWDIGYALGRSYDMAAFRRDAASIQGADMPLTDDDLRKVYQAVWFGAGGASLIPNYHADPSGSKGEWPFTTLGWLQDRIAKESIAPMIAGLQAQITAQNELIKQLASAPGQSVDLSKIQAAIDASVKNSIESIDVTVNTKQAQ